MGEFTKEARAKALATRQRNAKLRKAGKLPPKKNVVPLNSPLFERPTKSSASHHKKATPNNKAVILKLLDAIRDLL